MAASKTPRASGDASREREVKTPPPARKDRCVIPAGPAEEAGSRGLPVQADGGQPAGATSHAHLVEGRRWRLEFPPGMKLLNANDRPHYMARARIVADIRGQAGWLAKAAKIPHLQRARIDGIYEPPTRHNRDRSNLHPTLKAAVDGIVSDAHVLPDDSDAYLDGPHMHIGDVRKPARFVVVITELLNPSENPS